MLGPDLFQYSTPKERPEWHYQASAIAYLLIPFIAFGIVYFAR